MEAEAVPGSEGFRSQLEGPLAFYRGVCETNVDRVERAHTDFDPFLATQPNATMERGMCSSKAVTARRLRLRIEVAHRKRP